MSERDDLSDLEPDRIRRASSVECPSCNERIVGRRDERGGWMAACASCNVDAHAWGDTLEEAAGRCYRYAMSELGHVCQEPTCGDVLDAPGGSCVSADSHPRFVATEREVAGVRFTQWVMSSALEALKRRTSSPGRWP